MGSHDEKDLSTQGYNEIPLREPHTVKFPFPLYIKTNSPSKIFTGKFVRHPETTEISKVFSNENHVLTVSFVYHPSRLPRKNLEQKDWENLSAKVFNGSNS